MKTICVVTATRAEYGLLCPVIRKLRAYESAQLKVDLIVTGTHLSSAYGHTIDEIKNDNLRIDETVEIPVNSDSPLDIVRNQAAALQGMGECFERLRPAAVVLLGDRYETLMFALAAVDLNIPVIHLCGGDTTEGAQDEAFRHAITKMSYLHFPTNEQSRQRIIQLGEDPARVFNYGSPGIDNALHTDFMDRDELCAELKLPFAPLGLCTYHPVTLENSSPERDIKAFIKALNHFPDLHFVITRSNADRGGALINRLLDEEVKGHDHLHLFSSLGVRRYLSLMRLAEVVVGNSSSGIAETPAFQVPTVNIGDRQRGRLQAGNIINCSPDTASITAALRKALSREFLQVCLKVKNPYGDGHAAERIAAKIVETVNGRISLKKKFYNVAGSFA
ncbi:MAG: UDP-N-acetylglucosamine 2-epimerase (hydrolyzing) [Succinivibrio sp.]|nr:UDP-N-acetylglucosamine 2-epimerase (hydrolyzing) [Succinivibrio sp.]